MKRLVTALCLTLVVLLGQPSAAQDTGLMDYVWKNAETREQRVGLASAIRTHLHIEEYMALLPGLSPGEKAWLDGEFSSGGSDRLFRALSSNEGVIFKARQVTEKIDNITSGIISVSDERAEFFLWVNLAYILMNDAETEYWELVCEKKILKQCPLGMKANYRGMAKFRLGCLLRPFCLV